MVVGLGFSELARKQIFKVFSVAREVAVDPIQTEQFLVSKAKIIKREGEAVNPQQRGGVSLEPLRRLSLCEIRDMTGESGDVTAPAHYLSAHAGKISALRAF